MFPGHIAAWSAVMVTEAVTEADQVTMMVLEVAGLFIAQLELEVKMQ
jgi:hypothetical protein